MQKFDKNGNHNLDEHLNLEFLRYLICIKMLQVNYSVHYSLFSVRDFIELVVVDYSGAFKEPFPRNALIYQLTIR